MKKKKEERPPPKNKHRLEPLTLSPLTPEEALKAFMSVDPAKVEKRLKDEKGEK